VIIYVSNLSSTKLPGLEPIYGPACGAATPLQCTILNHTLPARVLWVAATGPPSLVVATQCHPTRQFGISLAVPLRCQVHPPNRHHRVAICPGLLNTAQRAASVGDTPITAGSLVWWMAFWTHPEILFQSSASGHLVGRGIAGMPLLQKPRVILHGPARTETARPTVTGGADYVTSVACQRVHPGLPFMVPAAFMDAAWASQPDPLHALVGEVSRHLAQVESWVPHALDEVVVGVCQRRLPLVVEPHTCDKCADKHSGWFATVRCSVAYLLYLDSD